MNSDLAEGLGCATIIVAIGIMFLLFAIASGWNNKPDSKVVTITVTNTVMVTK